MVLGRPDAQTQGVKGLLPVSELGCAGGMRADEAERDVVGAAMLAGLVDFDAGHRIVDRARAAGLCPEHFYATSIAFMWSSIVELRDSEQPVDPLAVAHELERRALANVVAGVIDVDWTSLRGRLLELAHEVVAVNTIEHRAGLVVGAARNRTRMAA